MHKTTLFRLTAILMSLLLLAALFACASSSEDGQTPAPEGQQAEPETDVVDTATAEPQQEENQPDPIAVNVPEDGTYSVMLQRDVLVDADGREYVQATQILYAELDPETIDALEVGDTVTLPNDYQFVIEMMQRTETDGVKEILFNEGLERCVYVPETDTWRFMQPSEMPYTYEGDAYVVPMAVDVILTDAYTPISMGESVYGAPYDETDHTIGMLDAVQDFFGYHDYLESEQVLLTVAGGEAVSIEFVYHP